ncbi:MAG: AMP-binding protein [Mesorhizobium sp.]
MSENGNFYKALENCFDRAADRTAFVSRDGSSVSYGEVARLSSAYAGALAGLGVRTGDRVTVQVKKSLANVALYLGALKLGAVYQPLNTAYTPAEVEFFVSDAEPALIVTDPSTRDAAEAIAARNGVSAVATLDAAGGGSLNERAVSSAPLRETALRAPDDVAALLYTSGTTGRSKGAMITHRNLSSNALALCDIWRMHDGDVLLHALPIFHTHGLFVALNTAFLTSARILWHESFHVGDVIAALPEATVMMGVPTYYARLLDTGLLTPELCRCMRVFISGSAPLLAQTHVQFEEATGHKILERYGMTECGMITSNPYDGARVPGTVGFSLPDVTVRIADKTGAPLGFGEIGTIEVRGPNVFKGYWRLPEKTAEEFREDSFFISGDLATMDAEGRVAIVGRGKDLIISGGLNVYPKEIETEIDALPGIAEAAVIGVPHPDFGEAVVAVAVATRSENRLSESDMIARLALRLAKFKTPKRIIFVDELPRNTMGKIQKAVLAARFAHLFVAEVPADI